MKRKISNLLLTPGPVPIPDEVWDAIMQPVFYHRNSEFEVVMEELFQGLQYLFLTEGLVFGMAGTGTTGMEALIYSLFHGGEKIAVANLGKFSNRWRDFAGVHGIEAVGTDTPWGKTVTVQEIVELLDKNKPVKGLILTHCETATGVMTDIEAIVSAVKDIFPNILVIVDGISSIGAMPFYFEGWRIDAAVVGSQKSLRNPAGTVYIALSDAAQQCLKPANAADCMNLRNYAENMKKRSYPYSPPLNLFFGVNASLKLIRAQSLPLLWNQTHRNANVFRKMIVESGWEIFGEAQADSLTVFTSSIHDVERVKAGLYKKGITMSGGQDSLKGKILRAAHYNPLSINILEQIKTIISEETYVLKRT